MNTIFAGILLIFVFDGFLLQAVRGAPDSTFQGRTGEFAGARKKPLQSPPCDGVPVVPKSRRACNFYIWDAPSALFYKWCHHLLKDNLYEGKGGHMFVRYESNSILQLLYPCSRYSPNRCLVCGGSFPDHLELWWSKHLYTPFDHQLESTYNEALILNESSQKQSRKSTRSPAKTSRIETAKAPSYAFHRDYVLDVSQLLSDEAHPDDRETARRLRKVKKKVAKEKTWPGGSRLRLVSQFPRVAYVVPDLAGDGRKPPSVTMRSVRALVLRAMDSLLELQERENDKMAN